MSLVDIRFPFIDVVPYLAHNPELAEFFETHYAESQVIIAPLLERPVDGIQVGGRKTYRAIRPDPGLFSITETIAHSAGTKPAFGFRDLNAIVVGLIGLSGAVIERAEIDVRV